MGIAPAELRAQRMLTKAFIDADSVTVTLYRSTAVADGAGGTVQSSPAPLPPQTMRLIPLRDGAEQRLTRDGHSVTPQYMLMGTHDADMAEGDTFVTSKGRHVVVFINENTQYQVKGEVYYLGE